MLSNGELNHLPMKERMTEIGSRWQRLPLKDKDRYKKIAEEKQRQYKVQLEQWLAVRHRAVGEDARTRVHSSANVCRLLPAEPDFTGEEHLQGVQLSGQCLTLNLGMTLKSQQGAIKTLPLAFQKRKSAAKPGGPKAKSKKSVSPGELCEEEVHPP